MNRLLPLFFLIALSSCSELGVAPSRSFDAYNDIVDLSLELEGGWERVCFIPPYSSNESAYETLGFEFDVENKSGISVAENITLVITVRGSKVMEYFETPRNNVDFSSLGSKCYSKPNAKFKVVRDQFGWPYIENT